MLITEGAKTLDGFVAPGRKAPSDREKRRVHHAAGLLALDQHDQSRAVHRELSRRTRPLPATRRCRASSTARARLVRFCQRPIAGGQSRRREGALSTHCRQRRDADGLSNAVREKPVFPRTDQRASGRRRQGAGVLSHFVQYWGDKRTSTASALRTRGIGG